MAEANRVTQDEHSTELVARWQDGDSGAAEELFERYAARLVGLARSRLSEKLARRLDAEDVVQSAFRSFFDGLRQGQYELPHRGDLWRLLVSITLHKLYRQARRHGAEKRDMSREVSLGDHPEGWPVAVQQLAAEPAPGEVVALAEEVERLLGRLDERHRQVAELRLAGYTQDEIAATVQRSQRTIRRWLEEIKEEAAKVYQGDLPP
jgi:RNA polymerase sigma-70 factor (ECF subfamily)